MVKPLVESESVVNELNPSGLTHIEHPVYQGQAFCGAPVSGVYVKRKLECVVCKELQAELRRLQRLGKGG